MGNISTKKKKPAPKASGTVSRDQYRIAHFGDMHLDEAGDEEYEWVLDMVARAREEGAQHLIFTGDIVDAAQVDIIENLFDDLAQRGLGPDEVSFVPGNHDIYPLSMDMIRNRNWFKILKVLIPGRSQKNWEELCRLSERMHGDVHEGDLFSDEGFPWSKQLAPGVVLVGLDSTRYEMKNPMTWAEGQLEEEAVNAVAKHFELLGDVTHRVVAMHHYPLDDFSNWDDRVSMKFVEPDAATTRNWLEWMGATSVLCGHIHDNRERRTRGGIRVFTTDSTCYEFDDDDGLTGRSFRLLTYGPGRRVSSRIIEVNE